MDALEGVARLTHWGVLRAAGPDAAPFLQGQLTQDVLTLGDGDARLAGYCSPKGRLLASFVVWRGGPDELLLATPADVLPAVLKRLSMFVLRAKCKLSDASADLPLHGLVGAAWPNLPDTPWQCRPSSPPSTAIRLPDADGRPRWLVAGSVPPALPALPLEAWQWLDVLSGVPAIVGATVEQFVPQMVNLERVGGVSFSKGCYPGQEVVARSQYRGTLKRRMFLFTSDAAAQPGQEVYAAADPSQPAGKVVNAASFQGRHAALVELKLAALDDPALRLAAADGPQLVRGALPYALPAA